MELFYDNLISLVIFLISVICQTDAQCTLDRFECSIGECRDYHSTCDGIDDCSDNSDESPATCPNGTSGYFDRNYLIMSSSFLKCLYQIDVISGGVRRLSDSCNVSTTTGLVVHHESGDIYYGAEGSKSLYYYNWATKTSSILYTFPGPVGFFALALDKERGFLYYSDTYGHLIGEINLLLNNSQRTIIQNGNISSYDFALDKSNRELYFASGVGIYKISLASASKPVVITVLEGFGYTRSLAADFDKGLLYFSNAKTTTLDSCNLDGSNHVTVRAVMSQWLHMTITMNYIFFTNGGATVMGMEKNSTDCHSYAGIQRFLSSMDIDSNNVEDVCMLHYEHCATTGCVYTYHICDGIKDCADGSDEVAPLCPSGPREFSSGAFLLVSDVLHNALYLTSLDTGDIFRLASFPLHVPVYINYNSETKEVFFVDQKTPKIGRYSLVSREYTTWYSAGSGIFQSLAIDETRSLLYVANYYYIDNYIDEIDLGTGSVVRRILNGSAPCCAMALDANSSRTLYYADLDLGEIRSIDLNDPSTGSRTVITGIYEVSTIALDMDGGLIYWVDSGNKLIQVANLDGSNQLTLRDDYDGYGYFGAALDSNYLYFTDSSGSTTKRMNRTTHRVEEKTGQVFGQLSGIAYVVIDEMSTVVATTESITTEPVSTTTQFQTQSGTATKWQATKEETTKAAGQTGSTSPQSDVATSNSHVTTKSDQLKSTLMAVESTESEVAETTSLNNVESSVITTEYVSSSLGNNSDNVETTSQQFNQGESTEHITASPQDNSERFRNIILIIFAAVLGSAVIACCCGVYCANRVCRNKNNSSRH